MHVVGRDPNFHQTGFCSPSAWPFIVMFTVCAAGMVSAEEHDQTWSLGYTAMSGHIDRDISSANTRSEGGYSESAVALSYQTALAFAEGSLCDGWRGGMSGEYGFGKIGNSNGSTGTRQACRVTFDGGPQWNVLGSDIDSVDVQMLIFVGAGIVSYGNDYSTMVAGASARTEIEANGYEASYGARMSLRWRFLEGWGENISLGVVRRHSWLSGDTTTAWSSGATVSDGYKSEDVLTALFVSIGVEKGF